MMWITLDADSGQTLTRQLFEKIRNNILTGVLAPGEKLPSTRALAAELGIARNTAIEVYSQLIAEGYLEAVHGSSTRVIRDLPPVSTAAVVSGSKDRKTAADKNEDGHEAGIDFCTGRPDLTRFPRGEWARQYREVCMDLPAGAYGYCDTFGVAELREALCRYLLRVRGITCSPRQVMITSGATQGLSLLARILGQSNKPAVVEDPSHPGLRQVIASAGCEIITNPVDEKGIVTGSLPDDEKVAFIYTTPSHQYPLGGILPVHRRLELIRYARQQECYLVEDDYDSEYRYGGPPVSSMFELDPDRVIYLGSFSKTLSPALRLGYMIVPPALMEEMEYSKGYSDVHTDALNQYTLAKFLDGGGFEKHIWKMKKHYIRRRKVLLDGLEQHFSGCHQVLGDASGLHLAVDFHNLIFTDDLVRKIAAAGVMIYPVSDLYLKHREPGHRLVMGYSHLEPDRIRSGLDKISLAAEHRTIR